MNIPKQWYPLQASTKTGFGPWQLKSEVLLQGWTVPSFRTPQKKEGQQEGQACCAPAHPNPSCRGLQGYGQAWAGCALSCPLSQGGPRGTGSTSGDKWLQGSSCLVPQCMGLGGLCSSKVVIGVNEIFVWVKTDSETKITSILYLLVIKKKKRKRRGGWQHRNRRVETNIFPSPLS